MSAIQNDKEMKIYFERKVAEGKQNELISAVRNKLIHRVFAVVQDERLFKGNYYKACA